MINWVVCLKKCFCIIFFGMVPGIVAAIDRYVLVITRICGSRLTHMFVNSPRRDDFLMWCSIDGMSKNRPELKFFSTASNTQNDPPTVENVAVTVKKHYHS